jgi:hypothetical protein
MHAGGCAATTGRGRLKWLLLAAIASYQELIA